MMGPMPNGPKYLCPQCGHNLRMSSGDACPECGYNIVPARAQHRGAVRYWRFLRFEQRMDFLVLFLWLIALGLGYRVIALSPTTGVTVLTLLAGAGVVGLGYYLRFRCSKKKS